MNNKKTTATATKKAVVKKAVVKKATATATATENTTAVKTATENTTATEKAVVKKSKVVDITTAIKTALNKTIDTNKCISYETTATATNGVNSAVANNNDKVVIVRYIDSINNVALSQYGRVFEIYTHANNKHCLMLSNKRFNDIKNNADFEQYAKLRDEKKSTKKTTLVCDTETAIAISKYLINYAVTKLSDSEKKYNKAN